MNYFSLWIIYAVLESQPGWRGSHFSWLWTTTTTTTTTTTSVSSGQTVIFNSYYTYQYLPVSLMIFTKITKYNLMLSYSGVCRWWFGGLQLYTPLRIKKLSEQVCVYMPVCWCLIFVYVLRSKAVSWILKRHKLHTAVCCRRGLILLPS